MTDDELAPLLEGLAPVVVDLVTHSIAGLQQQQAAAAVQLAHALEALKDLGPLRERVAVLETRPPLPGPPGQDGAPGPPGANGADGAPGLDFAGVFIEGQTTPGARW